MKRPKKKWVILIVVLIILIVAGIAVKTFVSAKNETMSTVVPMQTATLSKGTLIDSISSSGTIYSSKVENVCSSVSAPIDKIYVKVGDKVKAGQLLATLDMEEVYNNCEKAKATLNAAKRDLDAKTTTYETDKALYEYDGVTAEELKSAESALESAKESYENAQTSYNTLSKDLNEGNITAPIDGTVTESNAEVGLQPPTDDILFVVENINDLYVTANVSEYNIASIKVGQDVQVTTNVTGNTIYQGTLSYISPKAVSESGSTDVEFEVRVKILKPDPLIKIGMNAFLEIILTSKENVYSVPFDAVVTAKDGTNFIDTVKNNTIVQIPVETGLENSTNVEISGAGLEDGLIVVTNPTSVTVGQTVDLSANSNRAAVGKDRNGTAPSGTAPSGAAGGTASGQSSTDGTASKGVTAQ
ncbi:MULTISPECIES: efflux RND transporter periplasmic adaptor subunit [unclassified Dehalobacter]|uniref:efflux RND transporter periplasmic adaptor subunit n=1 Tax=unclassified Dehalobacter TaxID=2635733 RepID=UPI00028A87DC|nr:MULTISPECIES: efflux RND transporter periplasmic adaptor subunit [unclassified Dehalobacter]AFV03693.1 RND family efflux transporter, MFP subunit [Dehalobacter sp. DCA]AFV06680.1 RND family efflux transporter, MFP subunit [Dehalobacter sp. CF]